ncbi:STAS domain-containing protein [Actinoplanes sp. NPDC024001]|uniref:STAS domain-containing protein n=1 Tax=Actinoplanes sp. NPDC024001 TaxID=3154598 RepID=UPI0033DF7A1E
MTATPAAGQESAQVVLTVTAPAAVLRVFGDVDLDVVGELRAALDEAVRRRPYVIVDLNAAGTIDSLCLGALVWGRSRARRAGGDLLLVAPSRFVQTVLRGMRLDTAFRVFATVPQAITNAAATTRP